MKELVEQKDRSSLFKYVGWALFFMWAAYSQAVLGLGLRMFFLASPVDEAAASSLFLLQFAVRFRCVYKISSID